MMSRILGENEEEEEEEEESKSSKEEEGRRCGGMCGGANLCGLVAMTCKVYPTTTTKRRK
jgi:hypothetical protein